MPSWWIFFLWLVPSYSCPLQPFVLYLFLIDSIEFFQENIMPGHPGCNIWRWWVFILYSLKISVFHCCLLVTKKITLLLFPSRENRGIYFCLLAVAAKSCRKYNKGKSGFSKEGCCLLVFCSISVLPNVRGSTDRDGLTAAHWLSLQLWLSY